MRYILGLCLVLNFDLALADQNDFENRLICKTERALKEMINFISNQADDTSQKLKLNLTAKEAYKKNCAVAKVPLYKSKTTADVYENGSGYFYVLARFKNNNFKQSYYFTDVMLPDKDWLVIKNCNLVYKNSNQTCLFPKACSTFSKYFFQNRGNEKSYILLPANL